MSAGLELDARIAEKVMGLRRDQIYYTAEGREWIITAIPFYSTDLAVAWRAADRMCDLYDCTIEVKRMASFMPGRRYGALVCGGAIEYPRSDITAYGHSDESPAHALCLAMLSAMGVPE